MEIAYEDRVDVLQLWTRHSLEFIPHFHDSFEIVCLLDGSTDMMIGGEHFTLSAGDLAVAMPNTIHGYFRDNNVDAYLLIVPRRYAEAYTALLETHTVATPVVRAEQQNRRLMELIEEIVRTRRSASPYRREMICGCFTVLFGEIFSYTGMRESQKLPAEIERRLIAYCLDNYAREISLDTLSSALHISRSYISYIFSNKLHVSLPDFLGSLRIAEAKRQIERGASVTEAAFAAGFSSIRTFNRHFFKVSGMTPRDYKKTMTEQNNAVPATENNV